MQEALTTPATRTRCARTSTGLPTFPRRKGGTGGWSWGLVVRGAAKHLKDHPKVALRCEVRDPGAAELTAEDHVVLTLSPRNSLIEVRGGHGDVMYALTLLGEKTGIDAFLVEWLDKLPHHPADRSDRAALRRADARPAAGPAPRPRSAASSRSRSASPTSGSRRSGPCRRGRANAPLPPTRPVARASSRRCWSPGDTRLGCHRRRPARPDRG